MADALPIFQSPEETLQPQSVASTAQGNDALSNMFEGVGHEVGQVATQINDQQSNAMLYSSTASAAQAKNDFLYKLRSNPDPQAAAQAMNEYQGALGGIYQSAPVNASDRVALGRYLSTDYQSAQLQFNKNNVKQSNLSAHISFVQQWPDALQEFTSNLISNPDMAEQNLQTMQGTLGSMVRGGIITPETYSNYNKVIQTQMDRANTLLGRTGDLNAAQYHNVATIPGQMPEQNAPITAPTALTYNSLNSDYNLHDAMSSLYQGNPSTSSMAYAISKMSDDDFNKYMMAQQGVANAQAMVNSGMPYAALQARAQYLGSQSNALSVSDDAERNKLQQIMGGFKTDYLGTVSQTPTGQQINQEYADNLAAIKNAPISQDAMQQQIEQANNDRITKMVNYGRALGVPADQIKPIDNQTAATLQNAFNVNQDPTPVLNSAQSLNLVNAAYAASALKQPNQQQAMYTSALAKSTDKTGFSQTMIVANQSGQNYRQIIYPKGESNKTLTAEVQTAIQPQLEYLSKQPDAANQTIGMLQAAVNAVKYQAYQAGDMSLDNKKQYIQQVANYLNQAYSVNKGYNYSFNNTQTPMAPQDAQALATYASNQAINNMTKGMSDSERQKAVDNNPLFVTISPDNNVNVLDAHGNIYWQQPFTSSMLGTAKAQHNDRVSQAQSNFLSNKNPVYSMGLPSGGLG